jgi:DNA-binding NarL/FixJ family response regulator
VCKVLIADDSPVMRKAIRNALKEESFIKIVGEASSFGEMMQMLSDLKPDVLLLDLHLPEERQVSPELLKSQLGSVRTVAISFSNDDESKALAESYGASTLLDKMNLYTEMIPVIRDCHTQMPARSNKLSRKWRQSWPNLVRGIYLHAHRI